MISTKKLLSIIFIYYLYIFVVWKFDAMGPAAASIEFLDVGQGDATLITTETRKTILIDGGPDFEIDFKFYKKSPFTKCHINVIVLTHPHADHLIGLNRLLRRCKVDTIIHAPVFYESRIYDEWFLLVAENHGSEVFMFERDVFEIDGIMFHAVWPTRAYIDMNPKNINNASVVLLIVYKNYYILLPGDAEIDVQRRFNVDYIASIVPNGLTIYKAGHHGADNGTHLPFIQKFNPAVTVFSSGKDNKFGHPSPGTIESMESLGSQIYRTDSQGDIKFYLP